MSTVLKMLLVLAAHGACSERDVKHVEVMSQQSPVYVAGRATRNDYSCGDDALSGSNGARKAAVPRVRRLGERATRLPVRCPRHVLQHACDRGVLRRLRVLGHDTDVRAKRKRGG